MTDELPAAGPVQTPFGAQLNDEMLRRRIRDLTRRVEELEEDAGGEPGTFEPYEELIGNGVATSFSIEHGLNTDVVHVQVFEAASGRLCLAFVRVVDEDEVVIEATPAPASDALKVVVFG